MSRIVTSFCRALIPVGLMILFTSTIAAKKNPVPGPSGRDIFMDRCGACHGDDAKGNGPAVGALRTSPADLTMLAKRNGGTFPAEHVKKMVSEWVEISAHGSREMPIWGDLFLPKSAAARQIANERFKKLVTYLESIQE